MSLASFYEALCILQTAAFHCHLVVHCTQALSCMRQVCMLKTHTMKVFERLLTELPQACIKGTHTTLLLVYSYNVCCSLRSHVRLQCTQHQYHTRACMLIFSTCPKTLCFYQICVLDCDEQLLLIICLSSFCYAFLVLIVLHCCCCNLTHTHYSFSSDQYRHAGQK
jgi:hypothetical protein